MEEYEYPIGTDVNDSGQRPNNIENSVHLWQSL